MGHLSGDTDRVRARIIQSADPAKRPIARGSATPLAAHHGLALSRILDRRYRLCGFSSNSAAEDPRAPSGERCPPTSARIEPRWVFGDPRSRRTTPGAGRLRREYGRLFPDTVTASDWLLVSPSSGLGTQCITLPLHDLHHQALHHLDVAASGLPSRSGSAGTILGEHGNGFEAWRVIEGRNSGRECARLTLLAVDLCAFQVPTWQDEFRTGTRRVSQVAGATPAWQRDGR